MPKISTDPTLPVDRPARKHELARRRSERRRARAAGRFDHVERMVLDLRERFTGAELARMAELLKGNQP